MISKVAIPVHLVQCHVSTDETRDWSVVHEAVLLTLTFASLTLDGLADELALPRQVVVAALSRLMRHRLVETAAAAGQVFLGASGFGRELAQAGRSLPRFPREVRRFYRVAIERYSGCCFDARDVRLHSAGDIEGMRKRGTRVRLLDVSEKAPTHRADTLEMLQEIVERSGSRRLIRVESDTLSIRDDQFMVVSVADGLPQLPPTASEPLAAVIADVAASADARVTLEAVPSAMPLPHRQSFQPVRCEITLDDIILGGSAHGEAFRSLLAGADTRFVVHSTFLDAEKFALLREDFRRACERGVRVELLWGAEAEDAETGRNVAAAKMIAQEVELDPVLRGSLAVRMRTTGSHAKIVLADRPDGGWIAAVGSCNWLASPFQAMEASVLLRDPRLVADVAAVLQGTVGRRAIADQLAQELALVANDLRRNATDAKGQALASVVVGGAHEAIMRRVSTEATGRLVICTHRAGANVRPASLLPAALARERGVQVQFLYTIASAPMTRQGMRDVAVEASEAGVEVLQARKVPLHGKLLLWTPDDLVVTSHNWGSSSTNVAFPIAEVGVHVRLPGLAEAVLARLAEVYPGLDLTDAGEGS
jgi:cardiolipin synthase